MGVEGHLFLFLVNQLVKIEKSMPAVGGKHKRPATKPKPILTTATPLTPCLDNQGKVKDHGSRWKENDCRQCRCEVNEALVYCLTR